MRTKQQEQARKDLMANLEEHQFYAIGDFAQKWLPQSARETQEEYFGKKGVSWHVCCIIFMSGGKLMKETFVCTMDNGAQYSSDAINCMFASVSKFKGRHPDKTECVVKTDNAGCYHSSSFIMVLPIMLKAIHVSVKFIVFNEPAAGKDDCDRAIAKLRAILNEANPRVDIMDASDICKIIQTSTGMAGVSCSLLKATSEKAVVVPKINLITHYHMFQIVDDNTVKVWRQYGIGQGVCMPYNQSLIPNLLEPVVFSRFNDFVGSKEVTERSQKELDDCGITCPDFRCSSTFPSKNSVNNHVRAGIHSYSKCTTSDMTRRLIAEQVYLTAPTNSNATTLTTALLSSTSFKCSMGWAVKQNFLKEKKRFTPLQVHYK